MPRDLNNAKQNARLKQLEKLRDDDDDQALRAMLNTADGRRVLSRLGRDFSWMGEIWDASNARQTDFNAGRQGAARELMGWAERVSPEQFLAAIGEATRRDVEMVSLAKAATTETNQEQDNG